MAWKPQGGGPWGGGGGDGGGQGPWGGGGGRGPGGPGMPQPPDIEEMLRKGQDSVKRFLPGGVGGGRGLILVVLAVVGFWLASGFYRVQPGEAGVELLFGKFVKRTSAGLNYWLPEPIGEVIKPNVERTNTINIGFRGAGEVGRGLSGRDVPQESLMLTGDQNIIDIDLVVQWRIKNAEHFLFNIRDPEGTAKLAAESALREVVGQTPLEDVIARRRDEVERKTRELLQQILDDYGAGITIAEVKMQKVDPPAEVIDAFNDVQRAKQDQERSINEAIAYSNDIVPRAKGEAQKQITEAEAYKERVIKDAQGEAKRFISVYDSFTVNKEVTQRRLFLEKMQEVLQNSEKVIIDSGASGSGVVPYLPLPEIQKRQKAKGSGQ